MPASPISLVPDHLLLQVVRNLFKQPPISTSSVDDEVVFTGNKDWWGGAPAIDTLKVVRYESAEEIQEALLDGSLDVMWGDGVLPSNIVTEMDRVSNMNDLYDCMICFSP